jgi:hypothetical protein
MSFGSAWKLHHREVNVLDIFHWPLQVYFPLSTFFCAMISPGLSLPLASIWDFLTEGNVKYWLVEDRRVGVFIPSVFSLQGWELTVLVFSCSFRLRGGNCFYFCGYLDSASSIFYFLILPKSLWIVLSFNFIELSLWINQLFPQSNSWILPNTLGN